MNPRIIRVFPRRTSMTPTDELAYVGDPPMLRPDADEVHISVAFTWDIAKAERLAMAWGQYYPIVKVGGPALASPNDDFQAGIYVKSGVTFTSRGCNHRCPWCLVPHTEGGLRELPIIPGHIIQDNNLLMCSREHINKVFDMLQGQWGIAFSGGLDSRLVDDYIAQRLNALAPHIHQIFFAADTDSSLPPLEEAVNRLSAFSPHGKLRCYVLAGFSGEPLEAADRRCRAVWNAGAIPFVQLYQPVERYIKYSKEWRQWARTWSRPAATKAHMRQVRQSTGHGDDR